MLWVLRHDCYRKLKRYKILSCQNTTPWSRSSKALRSLAFLGRSLPLDFMPIFCRLCLRFTTLKYSLPYGVDWLDDGMKYVAYTMHTLQYNTVTSVVLLLLAASLSISTASAVILEELSYLYYIISYFSDGLPSQFLVKYWKLESLGYHAALFAWSYV